MSEVENKMEQPNPASEDPKQPKLEQMGGKGKKSAVGSRAQVWHGNADHTSGGLKKKDLMMNKHGRIVSKAKSVSAKKEKRLEKAGYFTKKGKFGAVKKSASRKTRKARK